MATQTIGTVLTQRYAALKPTPQSHITEASRIIQPPEQRQKPLIIIKPATPSWEALAEKLTQVINYDGLTRTAHELYEQGYGAELETAIEIALAKHTKKHPYNYFARMISKKAGNWATRTLKMVHETWEVRRNALIVMEKLKLDASSTKTILALSWRLKGTIMRFLGLATEKGTGIRNPVAVFFALTVDGKRVLVSLMANASATMGKPFKRLRISRTRRCETWKMVSWLRTTIRPLGNIWHLGWKWSSIN